MATYKLIQDIEAEDKILGPLTLRQFIFALIAVFLGYISFISIAKGAPFLLVIFLPPTLFFGFFALPLGRDQPTEIWALAKLRYYFKPRRRVWNQSGVKELVTITVPKKIEHIYSDGLSQIEVKSRLQALANTIDSRGWAVKNVSGTGYAPHSATTSSTDRLVNLSSMPVEVPNNELAPSEDMLDAVNNPIARQFDNLMTRSSEDHRQQIIDQINNTSVGDQALPTQPTPAPQTMQAQASPTDPPAAAPVDYWFMGQNPQAPAVTLPQPVAIDDPNEAELNAQLKAKQTPASESNSHMRTLQPISDQPVVNPISTIPTPEVTAQSDPAIISLAKNNDLNVATLAREASKAKPSNTRNEVVISLH